MDMDWKLTGAVVILAVMFLAAPFMSAVKGVDMSSETKSFSPRWTAGGSRAVANLTNANYSASTGAPYTQSTVFNFTVDYQDGTNSSLTSLVLVFYNGMDNFTVSVDTSNNVTGNNYIQGVSLWINYSFTQGTYSNIRFNGTNVDGDSMDNATIPGTIVVESTEPTLTSGAVTGSSPYTLDGGSITFNITYTDVDNDAPSNGSVWVMGGNGTQSALLSDAGGSGVYNDGDYTNGENLEATLDLKDIGLGDFYFRFNTSSYQFLNTYSDWFEGGWVNLTFSTFTVTGNASIMGNQSNETYNVAVEFWFHAANVLPMGDTVTMTLNSVPVVMNITDNGDGDASDGKGYYKNNLTMIEGKNTIVFNVSVNNSGDIDNYAKTFYFWVNHAPVLNYQPVTVTEGTSNVIKVNGPVDADACDTLNFTIINSDIPGASIGGTNGTITFTAPSAGTYNITVHVDDGNGSYDEQTITVTVETGLPQTNPTVLGVSPADGASDQPVTTWVNITFDQPMDESTFNSSTVLLISSTTQALIASTLSYNASIYTLTIIPTSPLLPDDEVVVRIVCYAESGGNVVQEGVKGENGKTLTPLGYLPYPNVNVYVWQSSFWTHGLSVVSTDPAADATNVDVDIGSVSVTFNHTITASTVTTSSVFVQDDSGGNVDGTPSASGPTITFAFAGNLEYGKTYTVHLTTDIKDDTGASLASEYTFSFSTKAEFLNVTSTSPVDGADQVARDTTIRIDFSKAINGSLVDTAVHLTYKGNGTEVAFTHALSGGDTRLTLTPAAPLEWNTEYKVTIDTTLKAADGSPFDSDGILSNGPSSSPYIFEFTTETHPLNATSTLAGATNVSVDTTITILFNNEINESAVPVDNTTITLTNNGNPVAINVTYDAASKTATIQPQAPLEHETTYTVMVASTITDVYGKALDNNADGTPDSYMFSFTTEEFPLNITDFNPADGAVNVSLTEPIWFKFNKDINESTLNGSITITTGGTEVPFNFSYSNKKVTIEDITLTNGKLYQVTIATSVATETGNSLINPFTWSFTTIEAPPAQLDITVGPFTYSDGTPISGATVTLTMGDSVFTGTTNATGYAQINSVKVGTYTGTLVKGSTQVNFTTTVSEGKTTYSTSDDLSGWTKPSNPSPNNNNGGNNNGEEGTPKKSFMEEYGLWLEIGGGVLVLLIIIIVVVLIVRKKKAPEEAMPIAPAGEFAEPAMGPEGQPMGPEGQPMGPEGYGPEGGYPEVNYGAEGQGAYGEAGVPTEGGADIMPESELFAAEGGPAPDQQSELYAEQPEQVGYEAEGAVPQEDFQVSGDEMDDEDLFDVDFDEDTEAEPAAVSADDEDLFDMDFDDNETAEKKEESSDDLDDLFGDL